MPILEQRAHVFEIRSENGELVRQDWALEEAAPTARGGTHSPDFTVEDLCDRIYPEAILVEMKHRVAVLRAAGKVMSQRAATGVMKAAGLGRTKVYYNRDNVQSYAMARLKTDHRYRTADLRHYWSVDEADLREKLADERHQALVAEGGAWHGFVQEFIAERDGDLARLKRLKAAARKRTERVMANLAKSVGRP